MKSGNVAICAEGVSKKYSIGRSRRSGETFREALSRALTAPFRRPVVGPNIEEFWALKDISFEVPRGEVLGIVGRNGAGKSTLLKVLSRITEPTEGVIEIRGRVASLLEVGTGFHGELTGRENVYLNGAILGMRRKEIIRKFGQIVEFAGVEKFIDTPVKHYSSGMYVRLAFAVAAHLEQEILFVDEVLAVGDVEFQKRCIDKMREISGCGRTVLFVSHNATALRNLCSSGLLLQNGSIETSGRIDDVLSRFLGHGSGSLVVNFENRAKSVSADIPAVLRKVYVLPEGGIVGEPIRGTAQCYIGVEVDVRKAGRFDVFLHCYNESQQMVFSSGSFFEENLNALSVEAGAHLFECAVPGHVLRDGKYTLDVMLLQNREVISAESSALSFEVVDDFPRIEGWHYRQLGIVRPKTSWRHRVVHQNEPLSERLS
jgi:lipopolysaccharide transport system ATP-binding protein